MKKLLFIVFLYVGTLNITAQFNAVGYSFFNTNSSFQLNPGDKHIYKNLFSAPLLNNIELSAGITGFTLYDLFKPNSNFNNNVYQTINQLTNTDFILVHYRQDLFSYGWSDDLERFKSIGIYWEFDHITYTPGDIFKLGLYGNSGYLNKTFDAKYFAEKTEFVQTMYYGINGLVLPKLNVGVRFKIYSGIVNMQSIHNAGKFYTNQGQNNFYSHHLENVDISFQSSGYDEENLNKKYYLNKLFFSGNYGPGIDLGFVYDMNNRTTLSASVLDLGFIYYTKDIHSFNVKGDYDYEGVHLEFVQNTYIDYWKDIKEDFKQHITTNENNNNYISWRPTTLYTSIKYGIGNISKQKCQDFLNPKTDYTNFIGITTFAQFRPVKIHLGISGFYEKQWSKYFTTKVNLTADNFSYAALGSGFSLNFGHVQFNLIMDNLLGLSDLAKSKKQSLQFGLNILK
jgi:hypothetical protein